MRPYVFLVLLCISIRVSSSQEESSESQESTASDAEVDQKSPMERYRRYYWPRFGFPRDRDSAKWITAYGKKMTNPTEIDEDDGDRDQSGDLKRSRAMEDFREPLRFGKRGGARMEMRTNSQLWMLPSRYQLEGGETRPYMRYGRRVWHVRPVGKQRRGGMDEDESVIIGNRMIVPVNRVRNFERGYGFWNIRVHK